MTVTQIPWWKEAVVYQIWPASYKDSNGDGVGDLNGILSTLDHVKDLGVSVIWLSPHYDSPQDDMGYDISDYNKIYPKYGTMEEMDLLIDEIHKRGMKIIFDLVVNHTSSEHAWFKESRSSLDNPKRDWYIWKKPVIDAEGKRHPPNNWISYFSGSAWEYDELTDEYYLRLFASTQPDLNWENEETRNAIYESALNFWYRKGVDGFRIDTAGLYSKDQSFPDAPIVFPDSEWQPSAKYTSNFKRIHEFHKEMYQKASGNYDVMTVGEVGHCSREDALKYVSAKEKEMNMMFIFDPVDVGSEGADKFRYKGWKLPEWKKAFQNQSDFIKGTDAWSTVFIENHDQPRSVTRFGNTSTKELHDRSAKLISLLQSTLTGTLFIYQGQEIGMSNVPKEWDLKEYKDINTINYWNAFKEKNPNADPKKAQQLLDNINLLARDNARTPVQWDDSPNAGFTTGEPWTRVNDNYKEVNVKSQVNDPNSILSFWKKIIQFRKDYADCLVHGDFEILDFDNEQHFSYVKTNGDKKLYIVLNFSDEPLKFDSLVDGELELLFSNNDEVVNDKLIPYEGRVYLVK